MDIMKYMRFVVTGCIFILIGINYYGVTASAKLWNPFDRDSHTGCKSAYPIEVTLQNWTFHKVVGTQMRIEFWRNGRANNLLKDSSFGYYFTYIVGPFQTKKWCVSDSLFDDIRHAPNTGLEEEQAGISSVRIVQDANYYMTKYTELIENAELDVRLVFVDTR